MRYSMVPAVDVTVSSINCLRVVPYMISDNDDKVIVGLCLDTVNVLDADADR